MFIREKPVDPGEIYDYEVDDLTEFDMKFIEFITSAEKQEELKSKFKDYGKGYVVVKRF